MAFQDNPVFEWFNDSDRITCVASGAVTGKTFVRLAANTAQQAPKVSTATAAADFVYGVAQHDAADGEEVTVYRRGVVTVKAGAALTAGAQVVAGAAGAAVAAGAGVRGYGYLHTNVANGADAEVALSI